MWVPLSNLQSLTDWRVLFLRRRGVPYVVELPTRNPFDEPTEWRVKMREHSGHP
jgi:hypothetical protein